MRRFLLEEHKIITTAAPAAHALHDMDTGYLRISPHVGCSPESLENWLAP